MLQRMVGNKFYFSPYGKLIKIFAVSYDYVMSRLRKSPRQIIEQLGYIYSAGSHFWMLPDIAIKHLIEIYKKDTTLNDVFRHAAAPEESYFQTSLSSFHKAIIPNPYTQMESIENEMDNPALRLINGTKMVCIHPDIRQTGNHRILVLLLMQMPCSQESLAAKNKF